MRIRRFLLVTAPLLAAPTWACGSEFSAEPEPFVSTPNQEAGTSTDGTYNDGGASIADASETTDATTTTDASDGVDSGPPTQCIGVGTPGALNTAGALGITGTYTDWAFSAANLTQIAWTLNIDKDIPDIGFFWSHQFGFTNPPAPAGYAGIQENGAFAPPTGGFQKARVALFSIGEGAISGELGDIKAPDGYVKSGFDNSTGVSTMVKFPWIACHTYSMRVTKGDASGANQWWNAYIKDDYTKVETFISRILVPAKWGGLGSGTTVFSERFGYTAVAKCDDIGHASAVFGKPTAVGGTLTGFNNHFYNPTYCPNSRFTNLPTGVRHEMGVK